MKDLRKIITLICWVVICFILISQTEGNAQVIKMSAKDLTERSTAVLYGKCSKVKSEWNEKKDIIFTYVTVVPEEYIKGNLGSEAVITIPGGQVDDILYEVSEMPVFVEGEEVVAFIRTNPAGKNLITGGYQGKMKIEKDKKTGKRMVLDSGAEILAPGQVNKPEKLDDFVMKLKGWAKN
jgi:hypothetical protein